MPCRAEARSTRLQVMATTDTPTTRIVVGVDGSDSSVEALTYAAGLAALMNKSLEAVTTWEYPSAAMYETADWSPERDAEELLEAALTSAFGADRPVGLTAAVRQGGAARVLIDESENAEMLVLGSRGHGGFAGLVLGSVSAACSAHGKCPVLVVHGESQAS
jgi:nucleotide-binding universal stress UspA family protein